MEDMFDERLSGLQHMTEMMGLTWDSSRHASLARKKTNFSSQRDYVESYECWGEKRKEKIKKICEPLAQKYGYVL